MIFRTMLILGLAVAVLAAGGSAKGVGEVMQNARQALAPSDAEIRDILVQRIDAMHRSVGIVVGVIDANGRRVVAYGHLNQGDPRSVNGETMFEIGSVTKVFTSLLLSEMVQRGEAALDDPVAKYLPPSVKMPQRDGKQITLVDLATHTSGLPRLPTNFAPKDMSNPYVGYTVDDLYAFLSGYQLPRDPGAQYEYSNLGGGLLGLTLSRRGGMSYGDLVKKWICDPLAMNSTTIELTPEMKQRLAVGHNAALQPVSNWDLGPAFAGAGALRSDADDMLTFVAANLGYVKTPLAPAMAAMLKVRRPTGMSGVEVALGWHIFTTGGKEIVWHNGGTGGYRSFIGFDPQTGVGVVALSNAFTPEGVDDIGHHLLDANFPLMKPASAHKEIPIEATILENYVGAYQLGQNVLFSITRDGGHLYAQLTGQGRYEIFPESDKDFFYKVVDAQITFVTDSSGKATALILHQNGLDQRANRVEGAAAAQAPTQPKEIKVDAAVLQNYVGTYQLAPQIFFSITRDGDHLYAQLTGQGQYEIFPESDKDFFYKVVDAQITFVTDSSGKATALILHQNGLDQRANRVEGAAAAQVPTQPKEIKVDAAILQKYVGTYQLAPEFAITITLDGDQLYEQATGQGKAAIYPESEKEFFLKVVEAQITFVTDSSGRATELILHQGGMDHAGKRVQ